MTEIVLDDSGHAAGVRYRPRDGGERAESVEQRAPVVFANAAPHVVAEILPEEARRAFMAPYVGKPLSISLFSIAVGLEHPPAEFGVTSYSTVLVPEWMTELRDVKRAPVFWPPIPVSGFRPSLSATITTSTAAFTPTVISTPSTSPGSIGWPIGNIWTRRHIAGDRTHGSRPSSPVWMPSGRDWPGR